MKEIQELLDIMQALRDPDQGCPWDIEQTIDSILPYTMEEVYELAEAIDGNDMEGLCDELGDLLFHVVYYSQMAAESGYFDFRTVARNVNNKLRRRHPHVFGGAGVSSVTEQTMTWERIKHEERREQKLNDNDGDSMLDGISKALPAIIRARKLQQRAAVTGFDWHSIAPVLDKIGEELSELRHETESGMHKAKLLDELGDLMFACVNFARHADIDPEIALHNTNRKFERRYRFIEEKLAAQEKNTADVTLDEMEALWQQAKRELG